MKQYLIETFKFNNHANKEVLEKIKELPDRDESVRYFSHLINSQNKWMARILQDPNAPQMSWWEPNYSFDELQEKWNKSLNMWIDFLQSRTEDQMFEEIHFIGFDGGRWSAKLKDMALQLNYHSIHHRAQIQFLIRKQGLQPNFVDYIGTVYKKIS